MDFNIAGTGQFCYRLYALCLAFTVVGCDNIEYEDNTKDAKFASLAECLIGIKSESGLNLEVVTDKPAQVSGALVGGRGFFNCERIITGTQGIYYQGTYSISTVIPPTRFEPVTPFSTVDESKYPLQPAPTELKEPPESLNSTTQSESKISDEMLDLEKMKKQGLISDDEYEAAKKVLLQ